MTGRDGEGPLKTFLFCSTSMFSALEVYYENALYIFTFDIDIDISLTIY